MVDYLQSSLRTFLSLSFPGRHNKSRFLQSLAHTLGGGLQYGKSDVM